MKVFVLAALALLLSACSAMDRRECLLADWQQVGYEDGLAGRTPGVAGRYAKACNQHGISPDSAEYQLGYERGIDAFCNEQRGYAYGASGQIYAGNCPKHLEGDFLKGYSRGRDIRRMQEQIDRLEHVIWRQEIELDRIRLTK